MVEISAKIFWGIIGTLMGLFETGFRIFISAMVISESAVDLGYLISQTEVYDQLKAAIFVVSSPDFFGGKLYILIVLRLIFYKIMGLYSQGNPFS